MKNLPILLFALSAFINFCCAERKGELKGVVDKFADLECRAMSLREKRFELANALRFTQDTLLQTPKKDDTSALKSRLEFLNKEKEVLLKRSLLLADTIHTNLSDLMKNQLADEKDRRAFDQMLNRTLIERGCIKK